MPLTSRTGQFAMKISYSCLFLSCLLGYSFAKPATVFLGYQDSLGQYSFGYSVPGSARSEIRTLDGATRGAYSYVDGDGAVQSAQYVADGQHGFRVVATNLPEAPIPVQETPEVAAARVAHLQALEVAQKQAEAGVSQPSQEAKPQEAVNIESKSANLIKDDENKMESKEILVAQAQSNSEENIAVKSSSNEEEKQEKKIPEAVGEKSSEVIGRSAQIVPVIPSHVVLPQIFSQSLVPVFRIAQGSQSIEPSNVDVTLESQGTITPAGTAPKDEDKNGSPLAKVAVESKNQEKENLENIVNPINIIPLSSSYSSFFQYAPALHYVTYGVL